MKQLENIAVRRVVCILIGSMVIACGGGCRNLQWEYNWRTFRFERVGPRHKGQHGAVQSQSQTTPAVAPDGGRSGGRTERGEDYRLYFTNAKGSEGLPADNVVVVRNAPIAKLAELIQLLYPGLGPGGRPEVQYIIYADANVWRLAKGFARHLDMRASDARSSDSVWSSALGGLYASRFPRRLDDQRRSQIADLLDRAAGDRSAGGQIRWAAGIIRAYLLTRYDPKDFSAAGAALAQADQAVQRGDYGSMVVRYHQIKQLMSAGQKGKAAARARETLGDYRAFRNTSCYGMIRAIAETK